MVVVGLPAFCIHADNAFLPLAMDLIPADVVTHSLLVLWVMDDAAPPLIEHSCSVDTVGHSSVMPWCALSLPSG